MKNTLVLVFAAIMLMNVAVFASVKMNTSHKGKVGKDGAAINCAYCHDAAKGGFAKKKSGAKPQMKGNQYCSIGECHKN
mgnify:CR=1 FL=1